MGAACSPDLANLYLAEFEQHTINESSILYYERYIDDMLAIVVADDLESALQFMKNSVAPTGMTLKWEGSQESTAPQFILKSYLNPAWDAVSMTQVFDQMANTWNFDADEVPRSLSSKIGFLVSKKRTGNLGDLMSMWNKTLIKQSMSGKTTLASSEVANEMDEYSNYRQSTTSPGFRGEVLVLRIGSK